MIIAINQSHQFPLPRHTPKREEAEPRAQRREQPMAYDWFTIHCSVRKALMTPVSMTWMATLGSAPDCGPCPPKGFDPPLDPLGTPLPKQWRNDQFLAALYRTLHGAEGRGTQPRCSRKKMERPLKEKPQKTLQKKHTTEKCVTQRGSFGGGIDVDKNCRQSAEISCENCSFGNLPRI